MPRLSGRFNRNEIKETQLFIDFSASGRISANPLKPNRQDRRFKAYYFIRSLCLRPNEFQEYRLPFFADFCIIFASFFCFVLPSTIEFWPNSKMTLGRLSAKCFCQASALLRFFCDSQVLRALVADQIH